MINKLIPFQLFCILLFSKTLGQKDDNIEVKVLILWRHLPQMEDFAKLPLSEWKENERFELRILRVEYGMAIEPPIAIGKTGHYDFALLKNEEPLPKPQQIEKFTVIAPGEISQPKMSDSEFANIQKTLQIPKQIPQQIGTQNVGNMADEGEAQWKRKVKGKGKQIGGMENAGVKKLAINNRKDKGIIVLEELELQIKMISPENFNIDQQQPVIKRFKELPNPSQILICVCDSRIEFECFNSNENKYMQMSRPVRKIFFEMNLQNFVVSQIQKIECTKSKGEYLQIRIENGVEYEGRVCLSDEYTFHFLTNGEQKSLSFKCAEAIYVDPKINTYQLTEDKCKLKLIEDNIEQYLQMLSNTSKHNTPSSNMITFGTHAHPQQQRKKLKENKESTSNPLMSMSPHILNSAHLLNFPMVNEQNVIHSFEGQQHGHNRHQPNIIRPISSEFLRNALHDAAQNAKQIDVAPFLQRQQSQPNLQHSQPGNPSRVLMESLNMSTHSGLGHSHARHNLQGQSSNPIHGSSVGTSEIGQHPTNSPHSKIAGTSRQALRQHLPQHIDLGHSSNQIPVSGQQIQQSGMFLSQRPMHFENPPPQHESPSMQGHRSTGGGARFRWRPSGSSGNLPTKDEHTKQLLGTMEQQALPLNLQMNAEEEKSDDEQTMLGLGLMSGQKRGQNESDGNSNDEEGTSGQKRAKKAKEN